MARKNTLTSLPAEQNGAKDELKELFSLDQVIETEYHFIPISKRMCQNIARTSKATANKLINSGCIVKRTDVDQEEYFAIQVEKYYGLCNRETMRAQSGMSSEALANYFELRADLLNDGIADEEIDNILADPKRYDILSHAQKAQAFEIAKESQAIQQKTLTDVTGVIASRIVGSWTIEDTNNLPELLVNEFLYFIEAERNLWENESNPKPETQSTDVEEKLKT